MKLARTTKQRKKGLAVEPDVQTDALYDFLYRDSGRIGSYYAQIFGGKLSTFEKAESERTAGDKGGKASIAIASFEGKLTQETQSGLKRTFDPHDIIASDVLTVLSNAKKLTPDINSSPHGSLFLIQGTLVFIDKSMMELAGASFDMLIDADKKKPKHQRDPNIQGIGVLRSFMNTLVIPSSFILCTNDGLQVAGTIKDEGMEEPISTYYFKHGTSGLSDVFLVGIKEVPSSSFTVPQQQLFGAGQTAAQALSDMLFPKEAIRVTPIAMFRKL
jgi:hypothetical protein